jgi:hypothetical protein
MAVGGLHGLALRNDGSVFGWGSDQYGQIGFAQSVSNVQAVAAGGSTSLVKLGNGTPFITLNPFSRTVAAGEAFKLTTFAVGQPSLSYQWQRNGDDLPAETNASLLVAAATLADAGAYRCIITNTLGAVASAVATITIQSGVPLRFDLLHVPPLLVSNGFQVKVNDLSGLGPLVIYASSNLVDWLPIFTNPANPGSVLFVDPATTNLSQRFYRASEER